ncbi:MAG: hypothetical protein RLZZ387_5466 [Chloroflexota bacterium]|jgi:4a-hydroxytetrahydrobiopterin dehydratase
MTDLAQERCTACRPGSPIVPLEERPHLLAAIPAWGVVEDEGIPRLSRVFTFRDYAAALQFVNAVAVAADEQDHHPNILLEVRRVTVWWWTHAIRNLHRNDFVMAARTDQLYALDPPARVP